MLAITGNFCKGRPQFVAGGVERHFDSPLYRKLPGLFQFTPPATREAPSQIQFSSAEPVEKNISLVLLRSKTTPITFYFIIFTQIYETYCNQSHGNSLDPWYKTLYD